MEESGDGGLEGWTEESREEGKELAGLRDGEKKRWTDGAGGGDGGEERWKDGEMVQ